MRSHVLPLSYGPLRSTFALLWASRMARHIVPFQSTADLLTCCTAWWAERLEASLFWLPGYASAALLRASKVG